MNLVLLALVFRVYGACPEPTSLTTLSSAVTAAEDAFQASDLKGFLTATEQTKASVICLDKAMDAELAARTHLVIGLEAYAYRNTGGEQAALQLKQAFGGLALIEPKYEFPESFFPSDHPIRKTFVEARSLPTDFIKLDMPARGRLIINGEPSLRRSTSRAAIFQWQDEDGTIRISSYLWPETPVPLYPVLENKKDRHTAAAILTAVSALSFISAGSTYYMAWDKADDYRNNNHSVSELSSLRDETNKLVLVSGGLGGLGLITGISAVIVW